MKFEIRPAKLSDAPAIDRLNRRLREGGSDVPVYGPEVDRYEPGALPSETYYVVGDGDEIRGSVYLRRSRLWMGSETVPVGWVKYPVSEGLVDKQFAGVAAAMILHLLRELPTLMAVGMGGMNGPLARLLSAFRWSGGPVPTFVLPVDPVSVIQELPHLAARQQLRSAASVASAVGAQHIARAGFKARSWWRGRAALAGTRVDLLPAPDDTMDEVFEAVRSAYPALADRTRGSVAWAMPVSAAGIRYARVRRGDRCLGWIAMQALDFRSARHRPYGALRVGVVHDMLAAPADALTVLAAGTRVLIDEGMQLLLGNHSSAPWGDAFGRLGYMTAPPSFACLASPALVAALQRAQLTPDALYITRGDDGVLTPT